MKNQHTSNQLSGVSNQSMHHSSLITHHSVKAPQAFTSTSEKHMDINVRGVRAPSKQTPKGFTLVELLVVLSILTVISTMLLANHTRFNSTVLLTSLAYDVALSVREAQVYGVSVRQFSDDFQVGYGVHFSTSNSYAFFADTNANQIYDDGVDSIIRSYSLSRGHAIQSFCGVTAVGVERCSDSETPITFLDVVFFRPDPDAIMKSNEAGIYSRAIITVSAPTGDTRTIEIASTGQISVQNE